MNLNLNETSLNSTELSQGEQSKCATRDKESLH